MPSFPANTPSDNPTMSMRPELAAGGFARDSSTVEFYMRLNALAHSSAVVLDLGAGRGAGIEGQPSAYVASLMTLRGRVGRLIGADLDEAVTSNPYLDEAVVLQRDGSLPFGDGTFDLVFSDWVLEHIEDPSAFLTEAARLLKPGGWLCARTPNKWGYVGIGARVVPSWAELRLLKWLQPDRQERDVFPKRYRLNSLGDIRRHAAPDTWLNCSYAVDTTPAYVGRSRLLFRLSEAVQGLAPSPMKTVLMVFIQRR